MSIVKLYHRFKFCYYFSVVLKYFEYISIVLRYSDVKLDFLANLRINYNYFIRSGVAAVSMQESRTAALHCYLEALRKISIVFDIFRLARKKSQRLRML
jgi:hypothetical protein